MKKIFYGGKSSRLINCIGDEQIGLEIAIASSETEQEHAVIALAINDELDDYVYLSPSQSKELVKTLEALRERANEINYQIQNGKEPIHI